MLAKDGSGNVGNFFRVVLDDVETHSVLVENEKVVVGGGQAG